ncbi:MAG TPA: AfsR/SARP family transcriptional regulator [Actinophytocola sp.]|uniref:AfsR/SARP family transcriptional regulator n=1 Tax=Actinophytocola sp. TaxID=1872138 RepID=UPI002DB88612|nr:AfsR/SARP family transcriptional regulator [Actinophytocola sp.]HEU5474447.1 AfsR/SARP family transcriptional regulator [Actinophytocola sp.]
MLFRVLGPIQVSDAGGAAVPIGARKVRMVLAVLLAGAGERVAASRLIDVLWEGEPPRSATANLHTYVWELRRRLPVTRLGRPRIERDREGYRLTVGCGEFDAWVFGERTTQGRRELAEGRLAQGARSLAGALELWRGAPYEDVAAAAPLEVARLLELRRLVQEDLMDARLHLGEHREVVDELRVLTTAEPLRERPWAQLMLALYRCGRRAEALYAYQEVYRLLDAELGIQPGNAIRELHRRILADDTSLGGGPPVFGHPARPRQTA